MKARVNRMTWCFALGLTCLASIGSATAQVVPNSGELLQQTPRPVPAKPSSDTGLVLSQPEAGPAAPGAPFLVQHLEISGNTLLATSELRALVSQSEGKMINLEQLEELAALITKRYQERGYLLSRAYIPAQTSSDGTVRIAVLEARYGATVLSNSSRVSDALLKSYLTPVETGHPVAEDGLQRSLLLLSDVPGTIVTSSLSPGDATGTSDLLVSASPGDPYGGSVGLDNAGNSYTGRARVSAAFNIDNPLHAGDVLSFNALDAGPGMIYGRVGYQALLDDGEGTTVGGALSSLYYHLGSRLSDLHAHGTAEVATATVMQPLIRSIAGNLFAQLAFDHKQLKDEIDTTDIHTDRHSDAVTATLAGDRRDDRGVSNLSMGLSIGSLEFDDKSAENADLSGARTRGTYGKFTLSLARLQAIGASNSVYLAFNGQAANRNLDSSEQFFLGGPNSVRAYDVGTLGGALGALATAELRHSLGVSLHGAWQAIAFVDSGAVRIYKNVFQASDNDARLSGVGMGLNWVGRSGWTASLAVAKPIGAVPALVGATDSSRAWAEVHKSFSGGSPSH